MCVCERERQREMYEDASGAREAMLGAPRYTGTAPAREREKERERERERETDRQTETETARESNSV